MAERDDDISRRYRDLAREEPPPALDATILAAARAARPSRFAKWAGPVSIAAVLVLGIGVSVRMQTESPGIKTQMPASEYAQPPAAELAPDAAGEKPSQAESAPGQAIAPAPKAPARAPAPSRSGKFAPDPAPASPSAAQQAPSRRSRDSTSAIVVSPPSAPGEPRPAPAEAPAAARQEAAADALASPPPPRAKREAMRDSAGARAMSGLAAADPDPARELERIAKARERGDHAEADRALEAFRREHPDYRIPDAMWARVRNPAGPREAPGR